MDPVAPPHVPSVAVAAEVVVVDVTVVLVEGLVEVAVREADAIVEVEPAAASPEVEAVAVSLPVTRGVLVLKGMAGVGWLRSKSHTRSHSLYQAVS